MSLNLNEDFAFFTLQADWSKQVSSDNLFIKWFMLSQYGYGLNQN